MIRNIILIISLFSLFYGSVLLFYPNWFINLTNAENTNIAWLRNIGASITGLLFFGCFSIYLKPRRKITLLKIITITSITQTLALIFSRFYNEFSAKDILIIDLSIYLAIIVCFYFLFILFFKSKQFK